MKRGKRGPAASSAATATAAAMARAAAATSTPTPTAAAAAAAKPPPQPRRHAGGRPLQRWLLLPLLLPLLLFVVLAGAGGAAHAQAARPGVPQSADFDHLRTGFALVDRHAQARCESCHQNGIFQGTPRDCASCHRAGMRLARGNAVMPVRHVPTLQPCDQCHHTRTFAGARFSHAGVAPGQCLTCHNHAIAPGKPAAHVPTVASCETCHRSTSTWLAVSGGHTAANAVGTGSCDGSHNGVGARGRHPAHIPVPAGAARCDSCHRSQASFTVAVRMDHAAVATAACAGCHNGVAATGRPPAHVATTAGCDSCHRTTVNWSSVSGAHTAANAVGTGSCDTCHNGTAAKGKHAGHVPVAAGAARCDGCHRSQTSFTSAVTMNHAAVATAECRACHNGQYLAEGTTGALAKPANHIPEAQLLGGALLDCKACHTSTVSWPTQRMNHNGSQGNGAGWCKSCHDSATRYGGPMERKALRHEAGSAAVVTDCSQSGCHRPLGTKGAAYSKWD
ncbi:MAG: hypothetical protein KJ023_13300 [Burkholderiaceae bacterium]|nr:hypothetical protein [Burkholderiaceae bacterium]